jgi:hypothetical protein
MIKTFKVLLAVFAFLLFIYLLLWAFSTKKYPVEFGISFEHEYATYLELDWKKTYKSILSELKPAYVRISAKWEDVEPKENFYSFEKLDFLMNEAAKANTKVTLVIGQKTPRWPECHAPTWANSLEGNPRKEKILAYEKMVIERYKNHPALEIWQVENEPFILFPFGECIAYDKNLIYEEIALVKNLDPERKTLVTDSGELSLWYPANKTGDIFGTTLYRVVRAPNNAIVNYDWVPPAFYKVKAFILGIKSQSFFVSELQEEPWFNGDSLTTPLSIQEETMSPERFKKNVEYTKKIGASRAYLWGVEWWYWMKEKQNDPTYWDLSKEVFRK